MWEDQITEVNAVANDLGIVENGELRLPGIAEMPAPHTADWSVYESGLGDALKDRVITVLLQAAEMPRRVVLTALEDVDAVVPIPLDGRVLVGRLRGLLSIRQRFEAEASLADRCKQETLRSLSDPGFDVQVLAGRLGMSYSHLARKLKRETGSTPTALIRHVRAEQAAFLMHASGNPITDVAFEVGFQSISHFNRAFRERFGCSPSEFRAKRKRQI